MGWIFLPPSACLGEPDMFDYDGAILPETNPSGSTAPHQKIYISFLNQPKRFNSLHRVFAPLASVRPEYPEYLVTLTGAVRFDDDMDASPFTGWWSRDLFVEAPFQFREFNESTEGKIYDAFILQQSAIFVSVGGIGTLTPSSEWYVTGFGLDQDFIALATQKDYGMRDAVKFWVTSRVSNRNLIYSVCYQITLKGYFINL